MAAFYLDNDVAVDLSDHLRQRGHRVTHTRDRQQTRANDAQQLLTALDLGACLVTHNYKDFALLHQAWELWQARWHVAEFHPSILVLPHAPPAALAAHIFRLLTAGRPSPSTLYRCRPNGSWLPE